MKAAVKNAVMILLQYFFVVWRILSGKGNICRRKISKDKKLKWNHIIDKIVINTFLSHVIKWNDTFFKKSSRLFFPKAKQEAEYEIYNEEERVYFYFYFYYTLSLA